MGEEAQECDLVFQREETECSPYCWHNLLLVAVFSENVSSVTPLSDLVSSSAKSEVSFCLTVSSHP